MSEQDVVKQGSRPEEGDAADVLAEEQVIQETDSGNAADTAQVIKAVADDVQPAIEEKQVESTASETTAAAGKYDRYIEKTREFFEAGQSKSMEAWSKAMESSRRYLTVAGAFTAKQGAMYKQYLQRDFEQTLHDLRNISDKASEHLHPARISAGTLAVLAKVLQAGGETLSSWSSRAEEVLDCQSGDMTPPVTLTCRACGYQTQLKETAEVPVCPDCQGTRFRKSY